MQLTNGGVCAPRGFSAHGVHAGIRRNTAKKDLALIVSETLAVGAGVYTRNLVKGAPLLVTQEHLSNGTAQAIICNSGNANTCNADGIEIATTMAQLAAEQLRLDPTDVLVASTGVIGQPLPIEPIAQALPDLVAGLTTDGSLNAASAIMTTDTIAKEVAVEFEIAGVACKIGGIAKGSGMIHPDMATMLVFLTTDVAIAQPLLQEALATDVASSFNMISVDGDTSTNDMAVILANGQAGNPEITAVGEEFATFMEALNTATVYLCRLLAGDGEGATRLMECHVSGAATVEDARKMAKAVIASSLVKSAIFGADANWGRVLCAIGYSGASVDVTGIDVSFTSAAGSIEVCKDGAGIDFSEEIAKEVLSADEVNIVVTAHDGHARSTAWGCDLTYEYVKINGDYRT